MGRYDNRIKVYKDGEWKTIKNIKVYRNGVWVDLGNNDSDNIRSLYVRKIMRMYVLLEIKWKQLEL